MEIIGINPLALNMHNQVHTPPLKELEGARSGRVGERCSVHKINSCAL